MVRKEQEEEEELEGEVIGEPNGEAVEPLSSGNTPFPFFKIKVSLQSHSFISVWILLLNHPTRFILYVFVCLTYRQVIRRRGS